MRIRKDLVEPSELPVRCQLSGHYQNVVTKVRHPTLEVQVLARLHEGDTVTIPLQDLGELPGSLQIRPARKTYVEVIPDLQDVPSVQRARVDDAFEVLVAS